MINGWQARASWGKDWALLSVEPTGWRNKLMSSITKRLVMGKTAVNGPSRAGGRGGALPGLGPQGCPAGTGAWGGRSRWPPRLSGGR